MKKVFISWSKKKSGEYAKIVKHTIQKLVPENHVFMSEEDIQAGAYSAKTEHSLRMSGALFR